MEVDMKCPHCGKEAFGKHHDVEEFYKDDLPVRFRYVREKLVGDEWQHEGSEDGKSWCPVSVTPIEDTP